MTTTLRNLRRSRLLSQRELGRRAGVSPVTVITTESGRRVPELRTVRALAGALSVDPLDVAEFRRALLGDEREGEIQ